jgi:hypothetical protein
MEAQLNKEVLSIINVEHTFYCNKELCINIFESIGYSLNEYIKFKDHSLFFYFTLNTSKIINWNKTKYLSDKVIKYFNNIENKYNNFTIDRSFYLAPAGYYGQMMYILLKKYKDKIKGFIDNDIAKKDKRVCGTPLFIKTPIDTINEKNPIIVMSESLYSNEIINDFLNINKNIQVVII